MAKFQEIDPFIDTCLEYFLVQVELLGLYLKKMVFFAGVVSM